MLAGGSSPRRLLAVLTLAALVVAAAACGSDPDAQPPVASVDFEPRLVVTVTDDGISTEAGPRDGAAAGDGDDPGSTTPTGSVVELANDAGADRRVLVTTTPLDDPAAAPAPWADTGDLRPGEKVVLGLSAAGVYHFAVDGRDGTTTVRVEPRPSS